MNYGILRPVRSAAALYLQDILESGPQQPAQPICVQLSALQHAAFALT